MTENDLIAAGLNNNEEFRKLGHCEFGPFDEIVIYSYKISSDSGISIDECNGRVRITSDHGFAIRHQNIFLQLADPELFKKLATELIKLLEAL